MPIDSPGVRLLSLFISLVILHHGAAKISIADYALSGSLCSNISIINQSFGVIHSLNFYSGQSQPPNVSCSWTLTDLPASGASTYILSLRVLELETDPTHWSNELTFWTGSKQISVDDINKRTYSFPSSSVKIFFRSKVPLLQTFNPYIRTNLRIRRFALEFLHVNNDDAQDDYFRCAASGTLIPPQWKCNCLNECPSDDRSDEEYCPLCSSFEPSASLLCQPNEVWCLPRSSRSFSDNIIDLEYDEDDWMQSHIAYSRRVDPKGVCVPRDEYHQCSYATSASSCEKILVWRQDHGQILLDDTQLNTSQSLCFVVIAKDEYKIKFILNQYEFFKHRLDLEMLIYDGSEDQQLPLTSSSWLLSQNVLQTRAHHIATIVIRKRVAESLAIVSDDVLGHLDVHQPDRQIQRRSVDATVLNITWITSICPDDQMLCGGHFETKCYTKRQRCDGIWDCISGDDELGCSPEACPTTFSCNDRLRLPTDQPRCFTWSERCNGNPFCASRSDEKLCSNWWCNSNNGTFLCKNLNCIYETWVCDGTDDCGDHSDEVNCPSRVPRRIVTAAVIGATVCSTLFIIALGCTCKLFHLRTAERRATSRLLNPQRYIEQRRQELQREQQRHAARHQAVEESVSEVSNDTRRIAPPSYNQTMGLMDENEERQAALAEHLRLAGLANYIALPPMPSSSRTSRSASRHRHRRHRRHRHHHHHHHRRAHSEGSRVALLEPNVVVPNNAFPTPAAPFSFNRLRAHLRSLFTSTTTSNDRPNNRTSHTVDVHDRHRPPIATRHQPFMLSARSHLDSDFIQARELPPPYTEEQLVPLNPTTNAPITSSRRGSSGAGVGSEIESGSRSTSTSSLHRLRKQHAGGNTLRDRMRQFISGTTAMRITTDDLSHPMQTTATTIDIDPEEQPTVNSAKDDDQQPGNDDDKILTP